MDRSVRSLISITLIVAAIFVAMDRIVQNAPLGDWWLVAALLLVAVLLYFWDRRPTEGEIDTQVEPGQSSLDGFRPAISTPAPAVSAPVAAASIAPKVQTQAESDHDDIVQAYSEIRDTDARSDGMASASTTDTQEARAVKDMVENIMDVGAMGTYEEVDEIAGGPVDSRSQDHPRTSPPKAEPLVTTPAPAVATQVPAAPAPTPAAPAPKSRKPSKKDAAADGSEAVSGTQARSDEMASAATMDSPEARESETGIVENIMDTGATGTPEQVDEIAGGPVPSLSKEKAIAAPPSAQTDDLTVIEGIGMKMAAALKAGGIDTFARLSTATEDDLRTAIAAGGMRFAPSIPTWGQQATYALKGDWSGLKEYQATLKGGRKK